MRQEICAGALHAFGVWHARGAYLMKQDDTHISIDHEPFRRTRVPAAGYLRVVIYRWTTFEPMPGRLAKLGFETALSSQICCISRRIRGSVQWFQRIKFSGRACFSLVASLPHCGCLEHPALYVLDMVTMYKTYERGLVCLVLRRDRPLHTRSTS